MAAGTKKRHASSAYIGEGAGGRAVSIMGQIVKDDHVAFAQRQLSFSMKF